MLPFKNHSAFHIFLLIPCILFFFACHKDKVSKTQVNFYLADSPFPYNEVNIDFRSVSIKTDANKNEIPFTLSRTGIYNILNFTNGADTLLASYLTPVGNLSQVHIILGDTNNIKINGLTFSLLLPEGFESGYILNLNQKILDGQEYNFIIDFDVPKSIVPTNNGLFNLKPVFRIFSSLNTGGIKGVISPLHARPFIYAIAAPDTFGTVTNNEGKFLIRGLPAGTYLLKFIPQNGLDSQIMENISVKIDSTTDAGTIVLN